MVKTTPDMIVSGLAIAWSVSLPLFPDTLFSLVDNVVGVLVLLVAVLLVLPYGAIPGVLTIVAVALTFVERNRRKIASKLLTDGQPSLEKQLESAPPMSSEEIHPQWEPPAEDETNFSPDHDQSDSFEPVASSINEKTAIPTIGTNTGSDAAARFYINQHLGKTDLLE
jgi:hypothetical protein